MSQFETFLVCIFPYSSWIRRLTEQINIHIWSEWRKLRTRKNLQHFSHKAVYLFKDNWPEKVAMSSDFLLWRIFGDVSANSKKRCSFLLTSYNSSHNITVTKLENEKPDKSFQLSILWYISNIQYLTLKKIISL